MNKKFTRIIFFISLAFSGFTLNAQVTVTGNTNTTPAMAATYTSLANAITALNGITAISGPVVITLAAGNPQVAPAGGYAINFTAVTTAAKDVVIAGNNNLVVASNALLAGSLNDAIFKIVGCDFVTIRDFALRENPANTTSAAATNNMTEWGIALLRASVTNGSQGNIIKGNNIQLNRTYSNSFGIYSNTNHTAIAPTVASDITTTAGANSNNDIATNVISNVNCGIAFIGSGVAAFMDLSNDIGGTASTGNTISNWGGLAAASGFVSNGTGCYAILVNNQKSERASFNTITSATLSGTPVTVRGISKTYTINPTGTFTSSINSNVITISHNFASGELTAILSDGINTALSTATININSNLLQNIAVMAAGSSTGILGIGNSSDCGVLNINNNIFRDNTSVASTGGFAAISNTGEILSTINIDNNLIGDATYNTITFSAATTGNIMGISCTSVSQYGSLSISNNNLQGFAQTVPGSGSHTYIYFSHTGAASRTDNINNNTFTNLVANTSGNVTFILPSRTLTASAIENCNNNRIVTAFLKPIAGGTVTLNKSNTSAEGNLVHTGNDFSNITLTGNTKMEGWVITDGSFGGGSLKTISNNIFKNWICGSSRTIVINATGGSYSGIINHNEISGISASADTLMGIVLGTGPSFSDNTIADLTNAKAGGLTTAIYCFYTGVTNISNNDISGISTSGSTNRLLGIYLNGSNLSCSGNTITGLTNTNTGLTTGIYNDFPGFSNGAPYINNNTIIGISAVLSASGIFNLGSANIFKNKIYNISLTGTSGAARGIFIASYQEESAGYNIYNNIIGDLKADACNNATAIAGIAVDVMAFGAFNNVFYNIFYNTVYINALSGGTNFGTSGISLSTSASGYPRVATVRNNIFINTSIAKGTGRTTAFRAFNFLNNYTSASNNNIFYAGIPSASNLIFYDGTNSDQTLAAYKTRVGPTRDASSFTEMPPFLSTVGSDADFLHIDPAATTQAESGAVNIATFTDDFDGDIREGNAGYIGSGTAPDIGADEINEKDAPAINFSPLATSSCTIADKTITGVTITDATGIPLTGGNVPRIYYRKNAGTWFSRPGTNTGGTAKNSTWSFTIVEADMGVITSFDAVQYYIIAQDIMPTPNVGAKPSAGFVASNVNSVTTVPTSPNTYRYNHNLSGTYTVGSAGNFTSLTSAIAAYNSACSLAGPVIFELIDNTYPSETFPLTINNHPDASATKTLTIRPSLTASPVIAAPASAVLALASARFIIIDGRRGGTGTTKSLVIQSSDFNSATLLFTGQAERNTIQYCTINGRTDVSSALANISFFPSGGSPGCSNNIIDNNTISGFGGFSVSQAIRCIGSTTISYNNVISNNLISDFEKSGIWIDSGGDGWTITGNRLFQTTAKNITSVPNNSITAIRVDEGAGYTIANNVIGFANASGTGRSNIIANSTLIAGFPTSYSAPAGLPLTYAAIRCQFDAAGTTSTIDGNIIGGIAFFTGIGTSTQEGMFSGIAVLSGNANIGAVAGNTIGATSGNNSIYAATVTSGGTVVGIYSNSNGNVAIQNNIIGSITASGNTSTKATGFIGINTEGTANYTISNNVIGNTEAGNIRIGLTTSAGLLSSAGTLVITTGTPAALKGIVNSSTGNSVSVTGNTLRGWQTSATETTIRGIESAGTLTGLNPAADISNNFLGTAATVWGSSVVSSNQLAFGIKLHARNQTSTNVKHNDFRGIGFTNSVGISCISLSDTTAANNVTNITGNSFTNLAVTAYGLSLVDASEVMGSNAIRTIDSNKTVGTFNFTGSQFVMIGTGFGNGLRTTIIYNEFSDAVLVLPDDNLSIAAAIGCTNSAVEMRIEHNRISNVTQTRANFYAIGYDYSFAALTDTAIVSNNSISNITVNGIGNYGIFSTAANNSKPVLISNNSIKNLSLSRATDTTETFVTGIELYSYSSQKGVIVKSNEISSLSSSIDSSIVSGVLIYNFNTFSSAHSHTINANKIYDLAVTKPGARVAGIYSYLYEPQSLFLVGARRVSIYNNIVGDLRAPAAGSISRPSIAGISIENNRVKDTINIYHNTIDLRASSSHPAFSSAAVFTDTLARINSYGNIFNNISTPGATGKTVAYWRRDKSLTSFTGDYNSLYAGTPAANRLIYFDGTNSDQTLPAYKTRVGVTREVSSVTELPVYISLIGSNAGFLHLDPGVNCGLLGKAINDAGILDVNADFDNDIRPFWFSSFRKVDIGADETAKSNTWTGTNSISWSNPLNWSLGIVPNGTEMRVSIPAAPANQPVIAVGESFQVRDISINSLASLTNQGTLKVSGNISSPAGAINNTSAGIVVGSIEMNGLCTLAQTLPGNIFSGNNVKNLTITTEVTIPATAGQGINLWGALNFGFMLDTLTTNGNLTLKSTAASTASIGIILAGNLVKGDVTVERFINTGTSGGAHGKSWQFLSTPTTGQTIRQAWQENGTVPAGFGTIITGTGTGFDITTVQPSMKSYDVTTNNWKPVTNTNNLLRDSLGYMLFVRGDRSVTTSAAVANPTVLRSKGAIYQDSNQPPLVFLTADKFQSVGNPYASRIEFSKVRTQSSVGMLDVFYVWDPSLAGYFGYGGYQTITGVAGYVPTVGTPPTGSPASTYYPAGVSAPYIESGQAFFVKCRTSPGGYVMLTELNKATGNRLVNRPTGSSDLPMNRGFISASLFTAQGQIADGNIVAFENGLSNALNENDADKMMNPGENFGIMRNGKLLAVEARDEVMETDTVFYNIQNLKQQPYQFRFAPASMPAGIRGFLIDRYMNSTTAVSMTDSSFIDFTITDNPASYAADRFILVFKQAFVVPVKIVSVTANRNQDKTITVNWKVENEINIDQYDIERSADGRTFRSIGHADPINNNGGSADYDFKDMQPLLDDNFYRIKAIGKDGRIQYSTIVKVSAIKINTQINVYPNPIMDNKINIRFANQVRGNYSIKLTNKLGQLLYSNSVYIDQSNVTKTIQPSTILLSGTYQLNIFSDDGNKITETIIVP